MKDFKLEQELIAAIQSGDETKALILINSGKVDLNYKDKRGFTPLVHAHRNRLQSVVKSLYEHHATPTTEQLSVMNKMCRLIFDIPGENPYSNVNDIVNYYPSPDAMNEDQTTKIKKSVSRALHNGLCYGFSGLRLFMHSKGKGKELDELIQEITSWDGEEASLTNYPGLREKIRQLFDNVYFLSWAHSSLTEDLFLLEMQDPQRQRIDRIDLDRLINLLLTSSESKYQKEFNFLFTFRASELANVFDKTIFPNKMVRLNFGDGHWVSVFKQEDGYHYNDPESTEGTLILNSSKKLADAVVDSYVKYYSAFQELKADENSLYDIGIYVYDKVDAKQEIYPCKENLLNEIIDSRGEDKMLDQFSLSGIYNALSLADSTSFKDQELVAALLEHKVKLDVMSPYGFPLFISQETQAMAKDLEEKQSTLVDKPSRVKKLITAFEEKTNKPYTAAKDIHHTSIKSPKLK
ncbi:MAG: hypothetical protein HYX61_10120 [Gammaproteobacteria bacterium]|jgi:hypothetical protein|nr:hypothetical protein [Gammaproteobacteria bacterium]